MSADAAGNNHSEVPEGATLICCKGFSEPAECIGIWRGADGALYISGCHFGPDGNIMFKINPDGTVE